MRVDAANLTVRRGRRDCVTGVDVQIPQGELTVLLGPNGAGKSTLLGAMSGEFAYSGHLAISGRALVDWAPLDLARTRAVLPQQSELAFGFRVLEVVTLGRFPHEEPVRLSQRHARVALERVGLADHAARSWLSLSGGERQRVQLARVLAQIEGVENALLLLDEPTNHLDIRQRFEILQLARTLAEQGATVVAVLHDLDLAARFAHRALLMRNGRAVAAGPVHRVLSAVNIQEVFGLSVDLVPQGPSGPLLPIPRWTLPELQ